jgi:hypothetical protein
MTHIVKMIEGAKDLSLVPEYSVPKGIYVKKISTIESRQPPPE